VIEMISFIKFATSIVAGKIVFLKWEGEKTNTLRFFYGDFDLMMVLGE
jgi:hypothetical protein